MRQIFPTPVDDVDPVAVYAADDRTGTNGRPWLFLNMIASADGGVTVDGVSGGLGGPADKLVFSAVRGVADVILVAAGTVIAEQYRPPRTPEAIQAQRQARGQERFPRLAIVTNSLDIPNDHAVFDAAARPLILTSTASPADRRESLAEVADVNIVGEHRVDLADALDRLGETGASVVLAEGGPTLNGALVADHLIDELCLSLSPLLIGGDGPRIVHGSAAASPPVQMRLDRILEQDDLTFHRFVRS